MIFHHVGCACKDIDKTLPKLIKQLGGTLENRAFDPLQNADLAMVLLPDGSRIELISGEVVSNFLAKKITYYHVCYEVDDIAEAIKDMMSKGAIVVSEPKPAILFSNRPVAFLSTAIGLVELLQTS